MTAKEKSLQLCQLFGRATMFSHDNNGKTLTLETSKKMAVICVDEIIKDIPPYLGDLNPKRFYTMCCKTNSSLLAWIGCNA